MKWTPQPRFSIAMQGDSRVFNHDPSIEIMDCKWVRYSCYLGRQFPIRTHTHAHAHTLSPKNSSNVIRGLENPMR